jgi:hypothetical protein
MQIRNLVTRGVTRNSSARGRETRLLSSDDTVPAISVACHCHEENPALPPPAPPGPTINSTEVM